jgi:hypothetical protein
MPEMLLFAADPVSSGLIGNNLASSFKLFDLVDWHPDGWAWGEQELKNPRFRIIQWINALEASCQQLLGPTLLKIDMVTQLPTEYQQPRAFFVNLTDPRIAATRPDALVWWQDVTRINPFYIIPDSETLRISDLLVPHSAILV